MPEQPTLSLIVIRVSDIDRAAEAYAAFGIVFQQEQHGKGPIHYSSLLGQTIFELYPSTEVSPVTSCRLGFSVRSVNEVLVKWHEVGGRVISDPKETPWGFRAIVADADGHKIELTER